MTLESDRPHDGQRGPKRVRTLGRILDFKVVSTARRTADAATSVGPCLDAKVGLCATLAALHEGDRAAPHPKVHDAVRGLDDTLARVPFCRSVSVASLSTAERKSDAGDLPKEARASLVARVPPTAAPSDTLKDLEDALKPPPLGGRLAFEPASQRRGFLSPVHAPFLEKLADAAGNYHANVAVCPSPHYCPLGATAAAALARTPTYLVGVNDAKDNLGQNNESASTATLISNIKTITKLLAHMRNVPKPKR